MKTLNELYDEVEKENIPVANVKFSKKKAGIAHSPDTTVICIDYSKVEDSKEEKLLLAEEKAHYDTGAYFGNTYLSIAKAEYKAQKRMRNDVIPFHELKQKYREFCGNIDELSDYFGIPPKEVAIAEYCYSEIEGYDEAKL